MQCCALHIVQHCALQRASLKAVLCTTMCIAQLLHCKSPCIAQCHASHNSFIAISCTPHNLIHRTSPSLKKTALHITVHCTSASLQKPVHRTILCIAQVLYCKEQYIAQHRASPKCFIAKSLRIAQHYALHRYFNEKTCALRNTVNCTGTSLQKLVHCTVLCIA